MKATLFLCSLFVLYSYSSSGQDRDLEIIKNLNLDWLNAFPKRDSTALSKVLADDFILITPQGAKESKKDNLLNLMSPKIEFLSVVIDSEEVRLLSSDIAVLTAWTSFVFKFDGKVVKAKNSYQDIYLKRGGKWFAVQAHVSSINIH